MVSPSTRGGGGPPRKPGAGNQSGISSVSTNKNQRGQNSQAISTDSASRGRSKSGEMRRPPAPGPSPSARSSERGGGGGRHAPSTASPPHSQQHRSYPATSRPSGAPVVRRVSRSPPPSGGTHPSPAASTSRGTRPSPGRFSSRHRSRSFSPKPPGGASVIKRSVDMTRATSGSPKRTAHARLSSPAKRNRSKSPGERYDVSLPAGHFTDRSSSRPSGIGGGYSEREQFRGPESTNSIDISELQKITVDIRRKVPTLGMDPLGRPLHAENVVLQRRPGGRYGEASHSRGIFDSHPMAENMSSDNNGSYYDQVSPPSQQETENRMCSIKPPSPSSNPEFYHVLKCEGMRPMFDRADIREGIQKRLMEERESSGLLRSGQESPQRIEQRVVAIIREPVILPVRGRSRERRYYEEDERRERERRGDSRDRHYLSSRYHGRDSPSPRHYERRRLDDLRLDLEMRRRDSERGRDHERRRSRSRDRDYYHRSSRHPDSYRDYRDRERDREREMREREHRHRDERDHRGGDHRHSSRDRDSQRGGPSYHRSSPPRGPRGEREERGGGGFPPPRPSGDQRAEGFPPNAERAGRPAPELTPGTAVVPATAARPPPPFDPEYVPKGRAYFEHDNRDTFVPMGRGRGGFPPPFIPRGGFMPRGGFPPRGRGRGGFMPGPPPFHHGGPPPFFPRGGMRGSFTRTKRRSPDWKHDLFETADQDQKPSSTTSEN